mgnify:CR=1 FL=1
MLGKIFDEWRQKNPHGQPDGGTPANYNQRGFEWERPVHIEFFEPGGKLAFAQNAGLRTAGGWSRANRQKSLRLYARKEYDENNNTFNHEIFPGLVKSINNSEPVTEFKRFMLRNGGNDNNDWNATLLRDALLQSLVKKTGLDTQAFRPAVVFINGEYWGLYNLRERYDERYIEAHYNVDPESVVILEGSGYLVAGQKGDEDHYRDMINYIRNHDLSNPVHYNYIKTLMDVENFMEYCIAEIYCGNTDWPSGNIKFWRVRTDQYKPQAEYGQDGRWRWLLYDTDFGFSIYDGPEGYKRNHLEFATKAGGTEYPNPDWSTFLLRSLLKNQEFRTNFINRFADHLNTIFSPEAVVSKIRELEKMLEPEIPEHIERWSSLGGSLDRWKQNVDALEVFAENRPTYVRQHISEYFGLGGEALIGIQILEPEGGYVMVNSVEIDGKKAPWQGIYFKGNPIQVKAVPKEGYRFDGWAGAIVSDQPYLELNLDHDMLLIAKFTKE